LININALKDIYFASDEPVPYRLKYNNTEIKIRPIKVRNWAEFSSCLDCLTFDKAELNDIDIIKMSYLEFIFHMHINGSEMINLYKLSTIIKYALGEELISVEDYNDKTCLAILDASTKKEINGEMRANIKYYINQKEFEEIKKIILFQNIVDYDDRYVSPDVKELYNTYMKAMSKNQEDPTLERKKVFVMSKVGCSIKDINEMSYRIFDQLYLTNVEIDLYLARKIIQSSQKYDVKEDIIYPLFEKKKDKYECIFTSTDTLAQKGVTGAEQLSRLEKQK
jgi:hypothetical protein